MNPLHGKVINFDDINTMIPVRNTYLDPILRTKVKKALNKERSILFMPMSTYDDKPMQKAQYSKSKYVLVLFGIFEDGSRATIAIDDIIPYFEIKLDDDIVDKEEAALELFRDINMSGEEDFENFKNVIGIERKTPEFGFKIEPINYEIVAGKPLHIYQDHDSYYMKVYFDKLSMRKDAIAFVRAKGYKTTHDDTGSYYRVASRDNLLPLGNWLSINNFVVDNDNAYLKGDIIHVSINDVVPVIAELKDHLFKDYSMTCAFDIETYNSSNDGELPMPEFPKHNMFMISMVFQWYHASEQLLSVCLVDVPSGTNPDFLTVICNTEENLILAFAQIYAKMQPEIVMGFNSDNYDWKWIIERARSYKGLLSECVELFDCTKVKNRTDASSLYSYKKNSIKIEATLSVDGQNLQTPGYIPIDVMTNFRILYSTSEQYSLNFFLSKNKLGSKEDMPYQEMFDIYAETRHSINSGKQVSQKLLEKMALVAKYCVVDSIRCHDLVNIRNILQDKREVANISFTSVFDAFYRANGMKVRNLVIARGNLRNIKISNIAIESSEQGKYPGAWVFPPVKGLYTSKLSIKERIEKANLGYQEYREWLDVTEEQIQNYKNILQTGTMSELPVCIKEMHNEENGRPITGLDYSSLYPSLMMAYNLSPEYMIIKLEHAKRVNALLNEDGSKKHELHKVKFDFNERIIRGWSIRHDNKLDPTQPDFKFGLFPSILKGLFDARKKLKEGPKGLEYLEHKLEQLRSLDKEEFENKRVEYEDVLFLFNALDSKQRALKVFMNTFYGESGNKRSPLFMLQVAGGITTAGQDNIKKAYAYVTEQNCKVYYGDTDSLYLAMPEKVYEKVDVEYYSEKISKLEYWEKMIKITFEMIKIIGDGVNNMLKLDNKTDFLKMSYEESLFPCALLAKKKYFGLPHISKPNFSENNKPFIRGLALKTRGVSKLLVDVSSSILKQSLSYSNIFTLIEIVQNKIVEFYSNDWSTPEKFAAFIMTGVYKPNKKNVKMHVFHDRMIEERGITIIPGERIKYVVTKKYPFKFDIRGCQKKLSVGDKMDLADKAQEENAPIDIDYYMDKTINGQLARLITYHPDFQVPLLNPNDLEEIKKTEIQNLKLARKFVDDFCKKYYTNYENKGSIYKTIFKKSAAIAKTKLIDVCGNTNSTSPIIKLLGFNVDVDNVEVWLTQKFIDIVEKKKSNIYYGEIYVESLLTKDNLQRLQRTRKEYVTILQNVYYANKAANILKASETRYNERQKILEMRLKQSLTRIKNVYNINNSLIEKISIRIKSTISIDSINDAGEIKKFDIESHLENHGIDSAEFNDSLTELADLSINDNNTVLIKDIDEFRYIYNNLICNYEYIFQIRSIVIYLKQLRDKALYIIKTPIKTKKDISSMAHDAIDLSLKL
jgi:DNA polymerase elongation subunit (family B)